MAFQRLNGAVCGIPGNGKWLVYVSPLQLYAFYWASGVGFVYQKSTDGGYTWGLLVTIYGTIQGRVAEAIWFDQWTPGDSGTLVHCCYSDQGSDDVMYRSLDVSSDTLGTQVVVFNGASFNVSAVFSITKAVGGNLYIGFNGDAGTEHGFYRSTDAGSSWGSRTSLTEASALDPFVLLPANLADTQDIWAVFLDASANEFSLKTHDDSANSWAETSIFTGTSIATATLFGAVVRPSDGHILFAGWNQHNNTNADLVTYDITDAGTITAKTNVLTDIGNAHYANLALHGNGEISVFYTGHEDESESGTNKGLYRKVSQDGMATWGSQEQLTSPTTHEQIWNVIGVAPHQSHPFPLVGLGVSATSGGVYFPVPSAVLGRGIGRGM